MPAEPRQSSIELRSISQAVRSMKLILDRLMGNGPGGRLDTLMTWQDLIDAGVCTEEQARKIVVEG
jgi:hypothetical protein